jgi:hypothetical protein
VWQEENMTRWLLTVFVPRGPTPLVSKLIELAERRPVAMGGDDITAANFAYDAQQDAEAARTRVEAAQLGAFCFIHSFHAGPPA